MTSKEQPFPKDAPDELDRCRERMENLKNCFRTCGLINSTLELDEVLENIMTSSRAILKADACSLMLVDEQSGELVFEVAQGPVAHMLKTGFRLKKGEGIAGHVFESGQPVLIEDAYKDPRFHQDFDQRTGYRTHSILCVPIKVKDRIIGVSQIINRLDGAPFDREDEETLSLLCTHAGIAVENARMHRALLRKQQIESDLAFATTIQLSFLPQDVPRIPGYRFQAFYKAAQEVSGDFYDFIPLEGDRLGVLIGDVSGKGVAAALYMARLTSDFRLLAIRERDPALLIGRINDLLCERSRRGMFVTLSYMVLDHAARHIAFVNAGHLPPILWNGRTSRYTVLQDGGGPPAGILAGHRYTSSEVRLEPGDAIVLSTDGVTEAKDPEGNLFGRERLEEAVRRGGVRIEDIYRSLTEALEGFRRERPPADDTTVVLFGVQES
ncbi:MAG: GAF domain-containing SpoIIE family protein phosphatase [Syntrophobacteraceae bacterium]|nr:SpoIIE family protein phosphatase [Desulfobacteraceae bacterium]